MADTASSEAAVLWIFESGDLVAISIALGGAAYSFMSGFVRGFQISYAADVKPFSAEAHTAAERILKGINALGAQQRDSVKSNIGGWLTKVLDESFPQFDSNLSDLEIAFGRWKIAHEPDIDFSAEPIRANMEKAITIAQALHSDLEERPGTIFQAHIDRELRTARLEAQRAADAIAGLDAEVQKKYGRALGHGVFRFLKAHARKALLGLVVLVCAAVFACGSSS